MRSLPLSSAEAPHAMSEGNRTIPRTPMPLPSPPLDMSSTSDCVGGACWRLQRPTRHHQTNRQFCIVIRLPRLPAVAAPSHQREQLQATPTFVNVVIIINTSLFLWHLVSIVQGYRPVIIFFKNRCTHCNLFRGCNGEF